MGCDQSNQQAASIIQIETEQEFKLSFRELVVQDRGQIFELYHFSTIISRSNFSIVRKIISRNSQQSRTCKIRPLKGEKGFSILSEVQFLKKLDHPNVIQIIQYFLESSYLYIVMEQFPGNKILSELKAFKREIYFEDIVEIMKQIISALDFCHRKKIAHRCINFDNILLAWSDSVPIAKIIDFSQASDIECPKQPPICAEKRLVKFTQQQYQNSKKLDVFDCGYLFYGLLLGKKPQQVSKNQIWKGCQQAINNLNLPKKVSQDLKVLLRNMLSLDPFRRPQFGECLNYDFFKHYKKRANRKQAIQNLMQFNCDSNLIYLLSMYSSLNMTSSIDRSQYIIQFYNLDKNKDGQIQLQELIEGLTNTLNVSRQKATTYAQSIFANLDKNKSGSLNFSQFITGTAKLSKLYTQQFLKLMFNEMDANKDGHISQKQLNNLISGIDKYQLFDGRKEISYKQFRQIMKSVLRKQNRKS